MKYLKGKEPWEYPDGELITLCDDCHERVEETIKFIRRVLWHPKQSEMIYQLFRTKIQMSYDDVIKLLIAAEKEAERGD